ncbi:hypothetical protein YPPY53_4542, partial [Yersinia pestis PY-53]
MNHINTTCT